MFMVFFFWILDFVIICEHEHLTPTVVRCVAGGRSYTDSESPETPPVCVCRVFPQSVYTESLFADITTEDLIAV